MEFGEALTRKRQAPRKCLRQKPLNRGVTSQAASHHAWFRVNCVAGCARHFNTSPERLGPEQVRSYLLHLVQEHHVSWSYYCQVRSALQFLYRVTLGMDWVVEEVACPKVPKRLPVILSPDELVRFFKAANNLKHRVILMTTYAAGLRLSEVCRLQVEDIDSARMVIHIRQSKGHRDRDV